MCRKRSFRDEVADKLALATIARKEHGGSRSVVRTAVSVAVRGTSRRGPESPAERVTLVSLVHIPEEPLSGLSGRCGGYLRLRRHCARSFGVHPCRPFA